MKVSFLKKLDVFLLMATLALTGWGLFHLSTITTHYFIRQLWWTGLGICLLWVFSCFRSRLWERLSYPIYLVVFLSLILVLLVGTEINAARRWISLGGVTFQPSEYAKIALIFALARLLSSRSPIGWKKISLSLFLTVVFSILIAREPDLGGALLLLPIWVAILFLSGVSLKKLLPLLGGMIAFLPLSFFFLHPYQRRRILTFITPQGDPLGSGWNIRQSEIALGSGRLLGRGMGGAAHTQLKFLPNPFTDFIFSSMGEEWGFLGVLVVLGLYFVIIHRGLTLARERGRSFPGLVAAGIVFVLFLQVLINVGVASGIMPVTGIPLPLISCGGNSTLLFLSAMGILLGLRKEGSGLNI